MMSSFSVRYSHPLLLIGLGRAITFPGLRRDRSE